MRSVEIDKIGPVDSDIGSSRTSGLSSLWEDGTYPRVSFQLCQSHLGAIYCGPVHREAPGKVLVTWKGQSRLT